MTKHHELKSWPEHFAALRRGEKDFEVRLNDRNFEVGDTLVLKEFIPFPGSTDFTDHPAGQFTGQREVRMIKHMAGDLPGLAPNHVILGLAPDNRPPQASSPLHQKVIDLMVSGGRYDEVGQKVIDLVRSENGSLGGSAPAVDYSKVYGGGGGHGGGGANGTCGGKSPIPPDVYWSERNQAFQSQITGRNCGEAFFERWHDRCAEFPTSAVGVGSQKPSMRDLPEYEEEQTHAFDGMVWSDPAKPLTAHERELLTILSEECAEVVIQVSKLLRFGRIGIDHSVTPNMKYDNIALLGMECGHVQHMINVVQACELIWPSSVTAGDHEKGEKLRKYLQSRQKTSLAIDREDP